MANRNSIVHLILLFNDQTWGYYDAYIAPGMDYRRCKEEVEDYFEQEMPLNVFGINHPGGKVEKPIIGVKIDCWRKDGE